MNREICFQEWKLSSKVEIFWGKDNQSFAFKEATRLSNLQGSIEEAKGALSLNVLTLEDGLDGVEVKDGPQHYGYHIQV